MKTSIICACSFIIQSILPHECSSSPTVFQGHDQTAKTVLALLPTLTCSSSSLNSNQSNFEALSALWEVGTLHYVNVL